MELVEAMKNRRSIRGYKSEPIPDDVITEILDLARRSPSSVNSQPWEFVVLTGESLEIVRRTNVEQTLAGAQMLPDVPAQLYTGRYRERQVELGKVFYGLMHIERGNQEGKLQWHLRGMRFFDAPAVILICLDESVYSRESQLPLFDAGLVTQSIVLLALGHGLGTCIQGISVAYPEALKRALDIPPSKRFIVSIALGYPDWDFPVNAVETNRDSLEVFVTWKR